MKRSTIVFLLWHLIGFSSGQQSWIQIGDFNFPPRRLFSDTIDGNLYIGGNFKWTGTDTVNGICFWDGFELHKMDNGICAVGGNVCDPILMINRYKDNIYVGAAMDSVGGIPAGGIVAWDEQNWNTVGDNSLLTYTNSSPWVLGTLVHDDKLYATGFFRTAGGDTSNSVAYWDGIHWSGLAFPPDIPNNGIPFNNALAFYKGELYVGGNTENIIDGVFNMDIARFDGTKWKQVGNGLYGGFADVFDMVVYKDELYVCGYFRKVDGNIGNKIMRWDGEQWKEVGKGICYAGAHATKMIVHGERLFLVGHFNCIDDDLPVSNIATWDGERWCSFGNSVFNNKISCIAAYKGELYVGGGFTEVDGQPCRYFAKWVGDHSTDTCSASITAALEPKGEDFSFWPNPATDMLQIQAPLPIESVWVYDATGREVLRSSVSGERVSVSVGHLPVGLYYVALRAGGRIWGGKFVKV